MRLKPNCSSFYLFRLLNYETDLSRTNLCKTSINHFQQYIHQSDSSDPEIPNIEAAIEHLQGRLNAFLLLDKAEKTIDKIGQ